LIIETVRLLSARPGEEYDPTRNGNGGPVGPPPGNLARPTQSMVTANPSCPTLKSYSDERIANPLQNGVRLTLRTYANVRTKAKEQSESHFTVDAIRDRSDACVRRVGCRDGDAWGGRYAEGPADDHRRQVRQAIKVVADFVAALH
jgi:hypothetical protein